MIEPTTTLPDASIPGPGSQPALTRPVSPTLPGSNGKCFKLPRLGDMVFYHPSAGEVNYFGQVLAAVIVKLREEPGRVNLQVYHPDGCSCFMRKDVAQHEGDGSPLAGSWAYRE